MLLFQVLDLTSAENGLERELEEKLACRGEECCERVGCWCKYGVDAEVGA